MPSSTMPDAKTELAFEELTGLALLLCQVPIAAVTLPKLGLQWFRFGEGISVLELPQEKGFCDYAVEQSGVMVVPDAAKDPRFSENSAVRGGYGVRFYAGVPLVADDGEVLGTICVADYVARELSPEQLHSLCVLGRQLVTQFELGRQKREFEESEARLHIVTENAQVGLVIIDWGRRYVYANSTYSELLNLTSQQIVGRTLGEVLPDLYEPQIAPWLDRAFRGERISYELCKPTTDGHSFYSVRYEPTEIDGEVAYVVAVLTDITEQYRAEEAARTGQERFEVVTRATLDAIWDLDLLNDTMWWNDNYTSMFGHVMWSNSDTMKGWTRHIHPEDHDRVVAGVREKLIGEESVWSDEYRFRRFDGTYAYVLDRGYILRDDHGRAIRAVGAMQDVTEKKIAEASLKANRELLISVIDNTPSYIFVTDLEHRYVLVNQAYARFLDREASSIVGRSHHDFYPVEVADAMVASNRAITASGQGCQSDEKLLESVVMTAKFPLRDGDDTVIGVCVVATDITARTAAEDAHRRSEARYRSLFEHAPDGILIADVEGDYLDANAMVGRMLGYSKEELLKLNVHDIVNSQELSRVEPAMNSIISGAVHHHEWQFLRKDKTEFSADVTATMMPDGNMLVMLRDITERKRVDEALQEVEERSRFALEGAQIGVWDMDYRSGQLSWSETLEAQYGLAPGTFPGTHEAFIAAIHPDDRPAVLKSIEKTLAVGGEFTVLHRVVRPNRTVRWLEGSGRIELDDQGRPVRGLGISQDVTERLALEGRYMQSQKMEAIGRLAGGVAHDFNNLLAIILGFSELLLDEREEDDARRISAAEIHRAGTSAAALTGQLLIFTRKQLIEPAVLDLKEVVLDLKSLLGRMLGEGVMVKLELTSEPAPVRADRVHLDQVLMNLAANAREAMPGGGVLTIVVSCQDVVRDPKRLEVEPGPYVVLHVVDTGRGIASELRDGLFDPFFTTKELGKGTGFGLATVHGIVNQSGGHISVDSELGRGASFKILFPKAAVTSSLAEPEPASAARTLLVVDDAEGLGPLVGKLLKMHGYRTLVAGSPEEALEAFEADPSVELLLTDVVMPRMPGPELARRMIERKPELKVVYMSGYAEEAMIKRGAIDREVAVLRKPFGIPALVQKVREQFEA